MAIGEHKQHVAQAAEPTPTLVRPPQKLNPRRWQYTKDACDQLATGDIDSGLGEGFLEEIGMGMSWPCLTR